MGAGNNGRKVSNDAGLVNKRIFFPFDERY